MADAIGGTDLIYTELTNKALRLAYSAHHGQVDYNGIPYIYHPIHLAEQMEDEISCCAALLHDVVEDTSLTLEELSRVFPAEIIEVVDLLTHRDSDDYFTYLTKIKGHPIAKKVKLADISHNSDQTRCIGCKLSEDKLTHWREKYQKATEFLLK